MSKKHIAVSIAMTPFPYTVEVHESVETARDIMQQHRIRHLPVMEKGKPISILSERDLNLADSVYSNSSNTEPLTVRDVCTIEVYTVDIHTPLNLVAQHMADHHIGSAVVVKDGRLAGIFTNVDACRYLAKMLNGGPSPEDITA